LKEPNPNTGSRPRDIIGLYRKHKTRNPNPTARQPNSPRCSRHQIAGRRPDLPVNFDFLIEGGLYSVTALRETWARRRCILNTRNYHKQASTTSKAHFTRRSSSSSGSHNYSHSACQLPWLHPCAARVLPSVRWPQGQPGPRPDPAGLSSARASRPWRAQVLRRGRGRSFTSQKGGRLLSREA